MDTKWNDAEHDALRGLSMLAQLIYLKVFRRRMDYATGIAGGPGRMISYKTVVDECGFVPDPGSTRPRWTPSKGEVRAAIEELERHREGGVGETWILDDAGSNQQLGYVKKLPLADLDRSVQKGNDAGTTQGATHGATQGTTQERWRNGVVSQEKTVNGTTLGASARKNAVGEGNDTYPDTGKRVKDSLKTVVELPVGAARPDAVQVVFGFWQETMQHPRAILDQKRRKAVAARLRDGFSVEVLCQAVAGCKASAWHQGANDRRQVYDDLTLICRDAGQVEKFAALAVSGHARGDDLGEWLAEERVIEGEVIGEVRYG